MGQAASDHCRGPESGGLGTLPLRAPWGWLGLGGMFPIVELCVIIGEPGKKRTEGTEGKMAAPQTVLELIERFDRNRTAYRSEQYNEARLRIEFLNPFFEALGWDVNNKQGYAEAYK